MKRIIILIIVGALLLMGCAAAGSQGSEGNGVLRVSGGEQEKVYTVEDLAALGEEQADAQDITFVGVPLVTLLADAGFDPQQIQAVKAVASDGFSANYEPELAQQPDTLVAYARAGGELTEDDGVFRMVLPGQEGRLNVRQLVEIQVIP